MLRLTVLFFVVVITKRVLAYSKGPGCGALLTDNIVGRMIQGTASINSSFDESHAVLNSTNAWCSLLTNTLQDLTIVLVKPANLAGFEIQGRSSSNQYITDFKLIYKATDQDLIQYYPTDANPKKFKPSPGDGDEIVYFPLNGTKMKSLRFAPIQWNERICIRLELYGCVPVDGNFTAWSEWSGCSRSCGNGTQVRYRSCSNPAPANDGQNCVGDTLETQDCEGVYCPVDGNFTSWSEWSKCSRSCGNGTKVRHRSCSIPPPVYGGQDCVGDASDTMECVGVHCPEDGGFSDWSPWNTCSVSCGIGFQLRTRACTNPVPTLDGKSCEGEASEGRACNKEACGGDQGTFNARKSTDTENSNKYFIPMLVLAALLVLSLFVLVGVLLLQRSERRSRKTHHTEHKQ